MGGIDVAEISQEISVKKDCLMEEASVIMAPMSRRRRVSAYLGRLPFVGGRVQQRFEERRTNDILQIGEIKASLADCRCAEDKIAQGNISEAELALSGYESAIKGDLPGSILNMAFPWIQPDA